MKAGEKYGCLIILDEGEEYVHLVDDQIADITEEKAAFVKQIQNGKLKRRDWCSSGKKPYSYIPIPAYIYEPKSFKMKCNHDSVRLADFDEAIEDKRKEQTIKKYKCKCRKCGKIRYYTEETIQAKPTFCYRPVYISTKHTYSTSASNSRYRKEQRYQNDETVNLVGDMDLVSPDEYCGKWIEKQAKNSKKQAEKEAAVIAALPRRPAANYDVDFTGMIYESLEVLECVNDRLESAPDSHYNQRHQKIYSDITVYKLYRCRCYLCGKEQLVTCNRFGIHPPTAYGPTARDGYWSSVKCDCHPISSFQWKVNKLLIENKVPYRVETSFPGLYGVQGKKLLQFDFAVYNEDGTIKCLIECQGEQHERPVEEFEGEYGYEMQISNDELKREYVKTHNIPYIEISYKDKKYEKVMEILMKEGILN